jgi:hypothetical protein
MAFDRWLRHRDAAQCRGNLTTLIQCLLRIAPAKRKNTMEEPQGTGTQSGGQHYREIASKLREIARECRFPGARREILDLASRLERRADELDARSGSTGSGRTIN